MNLLILLLFGILSSSYGRYKIPEHDRCVLRVLLCDDYTKPLTPIDNSTLEMFETLAELNSVCEELTRFRTCLRSAENFCNENAVLDVGFQLLNNRRLAFDLCDPGSTLQGVYLWMERCVNEYSHSAIEFCTNKAVDKVGLKFDLGDYDAECRFLGEMHHCHISIVRELCTNMGGNLLEKLVVFRGERDFLCIEYEKERLRNLEQFSDTMNSYVQEYKNILTRLESEGKLETIDEFKNYRKIQEDFVKNDAAFKFQSRISPINDDDDDDDAFGNIHLNDNGPFNSETVRYTEEQPLYSSSYQEIDYTTIPPKTKESRISNHKYNYYASENAKYPIDIEIHSVSSEGNVDKQLETEEADMSPVYDETLNPFDVESDNEKNLEDTFNLAPSKPSNPSQHSYRPYELYRPRLGEVLEAEEASVWDTDFGIKGAEKGSSNLKTLAFDDVMEDYCPTGINVQNICPVLQENVSILVDNLIGYYKGNFISLADPLDMTESESYEKFPICKKAKGVLCNNDIWGIEDHESILNNLSKENKEIYTISLSTKIENHRASKGTTFEYSAVPEVVEYSAVPEVDEDSAVPEVDEDSAVPEVDEDSAVPEVDEDSAVPEVDEDSAVPEVDEDSKNMFFRRSKKDYPTDLEEIIVNVFELLSELKVNMMRMRRKLRETRMKENAKITSLIKTEL